MPIFGIRKSILLAFQNFLYGPLNYHFQPLTFSIDLWRTINLRQKLRGFSISSQKLFWKAIPASADRKNVVGLADFTEETEKRSVARQVIKLILRWFHLFVEQLLYKLYNGFPIL